MMQTASKEGLTFIGECNSDLQCSFTKQLLMQNDKIDPYLLNRLGSRKPAINSLPIVYKTCYNFPICIPTVLERMWIKRHLSTYLVGMP